MGLVATVMCNCFRDGLTSGPPYPRDRLYFNEEGHLLLKDDDEDEPFFRLYEWKFSACSHHGLNIAHERISTSWSSYRFFLKALGKLGWNQFPVLRLTLPEPDSDGGVMSSTNARHALDELVRFRLADSIGNVTLLVDSGTNTELIRNNDIGLGLVLPPGKGLEVGFSEFGFFVRSVDSGLVLFNAMRVRQIPLDGEAVELEDLDGGRRFRLPYFIKRVQISRPDGRLQDDKGRRNFAALSEFHVVVRDQRPDEFAYAKTCGTSATRC